MHQTNDLDDGYMGSGKILKKAILKYGIDNFKKEILHIYDNEYDMRKKEKELVVISEQTYNLNEGGYGGFGFINHHKLNNGHRSEESENKRLRSLSIHRKEKCKESSELEFMNKIAKKGREVVKEKYPKGTFKGRNHSIESKKLIGENNKIKQLGERNSQYGTCWVTKNGKSIKIQKEELDTYLSMGYNRGRK